MARTMFWDEWECQGYAAPAQFLLKVGVVSQFCSRSSSSIDECMKIHNYRKDVRSQSELNTFRILSLTCEKDV